GRKRAAVPGLRAVDPGGQRPAGDPADPEGRAAGDTGRGAGRGVIAFGLPRRSGNRHHDAVGVATESRAGWAVAAQSAGTVGFWLVLGGLGDLGRQAFSDFVDNVYPNIV